MGLYENAFRLMRECYAELGRDPAKCRIAGWRDAFFPAPFLSVSAPSQSGPYTPLISYFPPADGLPGDPLSQSNPFTVSSYLARTASALRTMLLAVEARAAALRDQKPATDVPPPDNRPTSPFPGLPEDLTNRIVRLFKFGLLATTAGIIDGLGLLQALFERSTGFADVLLPILETMSATVRRQVETALGNDPELLILWQAVDLEMTS